MDRWNYALSLLGGLVFLFAVSQGISVAPTELQAMQARAFAWVAIASVLVAFSWFRARNIGWHGATSLLLLIPFVGVLALLAFLIWPPKELVQAKAEAAKTPEDREHEALAAREAALAEREAALQREAERAATRRQLAEREAALVAREAELAAREAAMGNITPPRSC